MGVEPEGLGGSQFDMSCRRGAQHKFDVTNHGRCVQSAPKFIAKADPTPASKLAFVTDWEANELETSGQPDTTTWKEPDTS